MVKLLTIIGARPQIIKASALSRAIRQQFADQVAEVLVHTGQHYDENMSAVFFEELEIPQPHYNLQVGSGSHGQQTAKMIMGIEEILDKEKPTYVVIFGDTNSTLAGAIAASKIQVPIVHIEAGLRSNNKRMPEEINRIVSDHVSTYLFTPTQAGTDNLKKEGFQLTNLPPYTIDRPGVFRVGDIMYDNSLHFSELAAQRTTILEKLHVQAGDYILVTIHRNANTDDSNRLNGIFRALQLITVTYSVKLVLPLHPRTAKQMKALLEPVLYRAIHTNPSIILIPPVSFLEMTTLEKNAQRIITDSGGVQKEAYFFRKPCLILRAETEWIEIVKEGAAILCGADPERILDAYAHFETNPAISFVSLYGDGTAAYQIIDILLGEDGNKQKANKFIPPSKFLL
ncbi:non-hydrolyzing UDP-N-acetylglucosamine 2-epimerase [Spirosoma endbachense]|uniref:UDP-N-acetylglucosamine 2-epimerase (Non-hydrolyzing) n=1 Tax=Spirosoma endbachense TaxID=2666025 RepID=A0A6P1WBL0_9BACT|nr:UDP-N-acetylglucosamine 2-epimerase (non-hydrolyzing) [Spirosoma endbachense]QHW01370.1 UDP-N-acetylglucosamine 2-epimerase (non-hydrolyzing) [Spirosoma endbachense]